MVKSVKIYGHGWVGKAMQTLFTDAMIHDPEQGYASITPADVAFVCVPTPNTHPGGPLDTSIVESVVKNAPEELIIIRSTVMPGTCDKLEKKYNKNIVFMPEYLGETVSHPLLDETARQFLIIGGRPENRRKAIELFNTVFNANVNIRQMSNMEAEIVKLSENRAIMFKVAQCQELYDACEAAGVDYYTIREAVYGDDPRFTLWFTSVYPDARGANSKCIPKDTFGWVAWAKSVGANTDVMDAIHKRNQELIDGKN